MVDDLNGDFTPGWGVKRAALGRIDLRPRLLVDFGSQRFLELFVRLIGSAKIGMADEETPEPVNNFETVSRRGTESIPSSSGAIGTLAHRW